MSAKTVARVGTAAEIDLTLVSHPKSTSSLFRERGYSGTVWPDPPNSAGKSLNLGRPSFIGSTVSA